MIRFGLLSLILLSSPALFAKGWPIVSTEQLDGRRVVIYVNHDELMGTPRWVPGEGPIPLAVSDAVRAVKRWAKAAHAMYEDFVVRDITIKPIQIGPKERRWHYLIYLDGLVNGHLQRTSHIFAAVLFDGKVLSALEEPRP